MGTPIYDAAKRLAAAGVPVDTILDTIRDMEAMKPQRRVKGADPRATRLPQDWQLPRSWGMWAVQELGLPAEIVRREAESFRDYWCSKPTDATKLDWEATWRNWMRKTAERPGKITAAQPQNAIERRKAALAERIENDHGIRRQGSGDSRTPQRLALAAPEDLFSR